MGDNWPRQGLQRWEEEIKGKMTQQELNISCIKKLGQQRLSKCLDGRGELERETADQLVLGDEKRKVQFTPLTKWVGGGGCGMGGGLRHEGQFIRDPLPVLKEKRYQQNNCPNKSLVMRGEEKQGDKGDN